MGREEEGGSGEGGGGREWGGRREGGSGEGGGGREWGGSGEGVGREEEGGSGEGRGDESKLCMREPTSSLASMSMCTWCSSMDMIRVAMRESRLVSPEHTRHKAIRQPDVL